MDQRTLETLQEFGLSEKEAKVYLASLELGKSTAEKLAKYSGVNRSTTYVQIQELIQLGLMSTVEDGKKTFFMAESPERLGNIFDRKRTELAEQERRLHAVMPELNTLFTSIGERPVVRFFEGKEGLVTMREEVLKVKDKHIYIGVSYDDFSSLFTREELFGWSEKRAKRKIHSTVLYTKEGDDVPVVPPTDLRRIPENKYPFEADIYIYDNKVALASLKGHISGVIIENEAITKSIKTLFLLAWESVGNGATKKKTT